MKGVRLVRWMTALNSLLFALNVPGTWFLFFIYGRRPDGVEPASRPVLVALWLLGPLWSLSTLVLALIFRRKNWETFVNGAICLAYALLWGFVVVL